jgi:hypothetical protein
MQGIEPYHHFIPGGYIAQWTQSYVLLEMKPTFVTRQHIGNILEKILVFRDVVIINTYNNRI